MASYAPQSGVGGSVTIGATLLSVDTWNVHWEGNIIEAPSFTGGKWMEHCVGKVKGRGNFTGTWNNDYNPNNNAIKAGLRVAIYFAYNDQTFISDQDAFVESFDCTDDSDGKTSYTCSVVFDYIFQDLSGGEA